MARKKLSQPTPGVQFNLSQGDQHGPFVICQAQVFRPQFSRKSFRAYRQFAGGIVRGQMVIIKNYASDLLWLHPVGRPLEIEIWCLHGSAPVAPLTSVGVWNPEE
ncbi:MAG: hypothetical protein IPO08_23685 [Xanthomonadales bacterium]|nr:hypothetical protein [Xanthomonadales bacterium]